MKVQKVSNDKEVEDFFEEKKTKRGIGCRRLTCSGCLLFILIVALFILIFASKPVFVWPSVVDFLNNGIAVEQPRDYTPEETAQYIESQVQKIGDNRIEIPADYITPLVRNTLTGFKDATVKIDQDSLNIYWVVDESNIDKPLYGVAELKVDEQNEPYFSKIGFERIGLPEVISKSIGNALLSVANLIGTGEGGILNNFFNQNSGFEIKDIMFEEDILIIDLTVNIDILK